MGLVTKSDMHVEELPGIWRCCYYFPSNVHSGDDVSAYYVRIEPNEHAFVLHSLPNKLAAYLQGRFEVTDNLATGVWLEDTSPDGEFKGMLYGGVFQVIIDEDQRRMSGNWVGAGKDKQAPKIYDGRWEMEYAGDDIDALPEL